MIVVDFVLVLVMVEGYCGVGGGSVVVLSLCMLVGRNKCCGDGGWMVQERWGESIQWWCW